MAKQTSLRFALVVLLISNLFAFLQIQYWQDRCLREIEDHQKTVTRFASFLDEMSETKASSERMKKERDEILLRYEQKRAVPRQ